VGVQLADLVAQWSREAVAARGQFVVALSGGSALDMLTEGLRLHKDLAYAKWHVVLADERLVPTDHKDSNFRTVEAAMLKMGVPGGQVYPVHIADSAASSAAFYENVLRGLFDNALIPALDTVVLGMGEDGHTASLFPNHETLTAPATRLILPVENSPKPPASRVSMSLSLLNNARHAAFAVVGQSKKEMVQRSLVECAASEATPPAGMVALLGDRVHWIMDASAAPSCAQTCSAKEKVESQRSFVWFGSRGALAKKYTWKVMFDLYQKGQLDSASIHAVGSDAAEKGSVFIKDMIKAKAVCFSSHAESAQCDSAKDRFVTDRFTYSQVTRTKDLEELGKQYDQLNGNVESTLEFSNDTRIFYLSVPDSAHVATVRNIKQHAMPKEGIARFLVEKPFGANLQDCYKRQEAFEKEGLLPEQIWRLDHYMGKRGIRNMLDFRKQNPEWEALWNSKHISHVEVVVQENEDVADRIDFYAETGVVRDMMVNHMMEVLATAAMEFPLDWNNRHEVPEERAKVLQRIKPLQREDVILSQYSQYAEHYKAHFANNRKAREIPDGDKAPTLGYARLQITNDRWNGVGFSIVHAKAVDERKAYVRFLFHNGMELLFHIQGGEGNEFISASSGPPIYLDGWASTKTGSQTVLKPATEALQAYEVLLGDALKGDDSYFVTFKEIIAGYKAWDGVMGFVPITGRYKKGTKLHEAVTAAAEAAKSSGDASGSLCTAPDACATEINSSGQ